MEGENVGQIKSYRLDASLGIYALVSLSANKLGQWLLISDISSATSGTAAINSDGYLALAILVDSDYECVLKSYGAEITDNHEGVVSVRLGGQLTQSGLAHLQKSMAGIIRVQGKIRFLFLDADFTGWER